ncbi:hypothetical protein [Xanthomonas arboricola]|uniref:hypothetical protein n=1 Tax=Xanthomonas arboricola TaxID=56448 RepID=UPI00143073CF|nr:hypothetical protein [Xanthomonas arboricola]NJB80316.1 hypothetical protein [Xanthomonas arboricola]
MDDIEKRLGQQANPPYLIQPAGCQYTPEEVGRMLGNRVVQPHYAACLVRKAIEQALSAAPQVPEGWVLVPVDCIGAVRVARLAMLEKEDRADELMDAAMYADAASDLKKIIDAAKPEPQA